MKLINLSKKGEAYTAKAKTSFKLFGITFSSTVQEFIKPVSEENWYDFEGRKVSENKKIILNKWLKDHQRFIE
ncbi:hypothetical protein [Christiangramia crocea]|uniref:Uncharacterized protein n=1 Tax=Christiangramia crocea TaxID=2904124 RepID=A0A9X1UUJ4_9FLAO|nr:hypothetical protein [Gramella crocea]MCG9970361.1 hypothetical protein [Gramella crocea]